MDQFQDKIVSGMNRDTNSKEQLREDGGNKDIAKTTALAVAVLGVLAIPFASFMATRGELLPMLQSFSQRESQNNNTDSAVLAVDTSALSVRSKNSSAFTKELFEQAAVEHLAKLHRTYTKWAERNQGLMGSLLLKLTIDPTGTVVRVDQLDSQLTNSNFTKTVVASARQWKFPEATAEPAEITVPLLFIPKGLDPDTVVQWERKVGSAQRAETAAARLTAADPMHVPDVSATARNSSANHPVVHTNTTKGSRIHIPKPRSEEKEPITAKTNRSLAIRENPRFSAKSVHDVDEDTPLNILENKGEWLKVKTAIVGKVGFVRKEYITAIN